MNNFTSIVRNKFVSTVNEYSMLDDSSVVVIGFSGGADSVCLIHLLKSFEDKFGYKTIAAHLNHGIRGDEALRDAEYCKEFCDAFNIPFYLKTVDCVKEAELSGESVEECGRRIRYSFFNSLCDENSKVATAHNLNDNVETVIFNLARGTALKGAGGISTVRANIIRPIINCTREEIEGYCNENELKFVTDSTNLCDEYTRNKIRHNIIPVLTAVNSSALNNINSFSINSRQVFSFVYEYSSNILDNAEINDGIYDIEILLKEHIAVVKECIVQAYANFCKQSLPSSKVDLIYDLLKNKGRIQLFGNIYAEAIKNHFRFFIKDTAYCSSRVKIDLIDDSIVEFNGYNLTFSKCNCLKNVNKRLLDNSIDCDKIDGSLFLRGRREGDSFTFYNRNVTKTLKKLFNELSVPIEERDKIPVLCDNSGVVWVYNVGTNSRCRVDNNSKNIFVCEG